MTIAAPAPVFGFLGETAFHWIAVDVLKLLDEFFIVADVAVVITPLPERCVLRPRGLQLPDFGNCGDFPLSHGWSYAFRRCDLERLNNGCNGALLRF